MKNSCFCLSMYTVLFKKFFFLSGLFLLFFTFSAQGGNENPEQEGRQAHIAVPRQQVLPLPREDAQEGQRNQLPLEPYHELALTRGQIKCIACVMCSVVTFVFIATGIYMTFYQPSPPPPSYNH